MQRTRTIAPALVLAVVLTGPGGCAPVYTGYDIEAPDSPVHEERARSAALAGTREKVMADVAAARDAGQADRALAMLREYVQVDPVWAPAYRVLGDLYYGKGDYLNAQNAFARARRLDPGSFAAHYGEAQSLAMLDRFADAVAAYYKALAIDPDSPDANLGMAAAALRVDDIADAMVFAEKAVELDPENGVARANLGAVYHWAGRPEAAIGQYELALDLMAPSAPVLINLMEAQLAAGRPADALATAERLVQDAPTADSYVRLGRCAARIGDLAVSDDAYRQALGLEPNDWRALNGIGLNAYARWEASGKRDADAVRVATDAFRRSLQINPDQPDIVRVMLRFER